MIPVVANLTSGPQRNIQINVYTSSILVSPRIEDFVGLLFNGSRIIGNQSPLREIMPA